MIREDPLGGLKQEMHNTMERVELCVTAYVDLLTSIVQARVLKL